MPIQSSFRPRIVIHGCGKVGQRVARYCTEKGWDIVAALNSAGDKVGRNLGELIGIEGVDLVIEDADRATIPRGSADVAVVATTSSDFLKPSWPIYEKYLAAGINVLSHGAQSHNPFFDDPATAAQIDLMARSNNASFCGTTIWDTTRVWAGILAASSCVSVERVEHIATGQPGLQNPAYEAGVGIGMTIDQFKNKYPGGSHPLERFLHGPPVMVLQGMGCTISKVERRSELIVLSENRYSPHSRTEYPAGSVGGIRVLADIETCEGIEGRANVEYRLFEEGEAERTSWKIHGSPGLEIDVARGDAGALSAASIVNRIPDVIAARPGIVEIFRREMGPMSSVALL